jgi:putative transposase
MSAITDNPRRGHVALRRGRASLPGQVYHLTFTVRGRAPMLRDTRAARVAAVAISDADAIGDAALLAWVLMPDHAHCLVALGEHDGLHVVANRLKAATARAVNKALGRRGPFWQPAYHDHAARGDEDVRTMARYIVANPLRAGLVQRVADYPYWDAIWVRRFAKDSPP